MADATSKLKAYAKSRKLPLKLHKLSKSKLGLKTKTSYPELRSSGYDTYVVLEWLNDLCSRHSSVLPRDICTCLWCATHLMSMLHNAGQHLSPVEEQNKLQFGRLYLHCYVVAGSKLSSKHTAHGISFPPTAKISHIGTHLL